MKACIVPLNPGNLSAFGLLAVDWRTDHIVTKVMHEDAVDLAAVAAIYAGSSSEATATLARDGIEPFTHPARARGRRALRRAVDGSARAGARAARSIARSSTAGRRVPRRALQDLRLQLRRPAEGRAGELLRVRLRPDRPAEHSRSSTSAPAATPKRKAAGRCFSAARSARRRSTTARSLAAGARLDGPAVVEEFGSTTVVFPGQPLEVDPHGILIVRPARRVRRRCDERAARRPALADRAQPAGPRGRSDRAADRRGHAQFDRGRDRVRHRAHRALADDPRGARLSRRPVRPLLPQAHRPLLLGDAERGGARLPAGDHAAGRRVPDERHVSHRGLDRPPARSVQHGAGVPSRRGRRLHPGVRPSRRHRRPRAGLDAGHGGDGVRGRPRDPADQALQRGRAQRRGVHHHQAQHPRAGDARGRSRQRDPGLRHGRPAHGGAVRALRHARRSKPASRRSSTSAATSFGDELLPKIADGEYAGRTTSSTTASPIRSCTSSRSR